MALHMIETKRSEAIRSAAVNSHSEQVGNVQVCFTLIHLEAHVVKQPNRFSSD